MDRRKRAIKRYATKLIIELILIAFIFLIWLVICVHASDDAGLIKGRATVYSLEGKTAMGTPTRLGVCASGDKKLLGKLIAVYQRKEDDSIGDVIGVYSVEDTGCKESVIDIWCPKELQQAIINKTYENNCKGKIYIQVLEVQK